MCGWLWPAVRWQNINSNDKTRAPTALHHAHFVAFTQAAGLAAFTSVLVDSALICGGADVVIVSYGKEKHSAEFFLTGKEEE